MKRFILLSILCMSVMVGTVDARHHMGGQGGGHESGCKMGGGMRGVQGAFHHWIHRVMMHGAALNLSSDQTDRIGDFSALHAQNAIRNQAKSRVLKIDYRQALRKQSVDMKAVEKILKKQADLHFLKQKDGVAFYTQILGLLTPEQKEMIWDTIGSPYPHAWEKKGHHGGRHMPGMYPDSKGPRDAKPSSDKKNPRKTQT